MTERINLSQTKNIKQLKQFFYVKVKERNNFHFLN